MTRPWTPDRANPDGSTRSECPRCVGSDQAHRQAGRLPPPNFHPGAGRGWAVRPADDVGYRTPYGRHESWWGWCAEHLAARRCWVEDGRVMFWRAVPIGSEVPL